VQLVRKGQSWGGPKLNLFFSFMV